MSTKREIQLEIENERLKNRLRLMEEIAKTNGELLAKEVKRRWAVEEILQRIDCDFAEKEKMPCGAVTHDKGKTKSIYYILAEIGGNGND